MFKWMIGMLAALASPARFIASWLMAAAAPDRTPVEPTPSCGTPRAGASRRMILRAALLGRIARQLRRWADESRDGGWSTHQCGPMEALAEQIDAHLFPPWPPEPEFWTGPGYRGEYTCPHGVGHGNHIHGCDGCCRREDFPLRENRSKEPAGGPQSALRPSPARGCR